MHADPEMFAAIQEEIPAVFQRGVEPLTMREARPKVERALAGKNPQDMCWTNVTMEKRLWQF